MNNSYLIPANSKKSMLIFGVFQRIDLIFLGIGLLLSFIMLTTLPINEIWGAVLALLPGMVAGVLVFPIPNYHNMRTLIGSAYAFYTSNQNYIWKGWCFSNGEEDKHDK